MSKKYTEKSFLYLLCISLCLHLGVFAALYYFPPTQPEPPKEPVFIDLQQMPELKKVQKLDKQTSPHLSDRKVQVERETSPRGEGARETTSLDPLINRPSEQKPTEQKELPVAPGSSVASLLKPKHQVEMQQKERPNLFPKTEKLARLEEAYRRKFESDIEEGESLILNTQDTKLISFFRRFENAIYGVWQIPNDAVSGDVTFLITFNSSNGQVMDIKKVESSGHRNLDDAALNGLRLMGPLGALHKDFKKSEYKMFVTFIYGQSFRRVLR